MKTRSWCLLAGSLAAGMLLTGLAVGRAEEPPEKVYQEPPPRHDSWLSAGYRSYSLQGDARQALEYGYLRSHPSVLGALYGNPGKTHLYLDFAYFNPHDYRLEGIADYSGQLRGEVRLEGLFHNLDHVDWNRQAASVPGTPDPVVTFGEQDRLLRHGVAVDLTDVGLRAKLGNYPAHINLNYWRFEKSGHRQLRFVDENCSSCHMQSRTVGVDGVTEEVTLGIDAHLGPVDLGVEHLVREFRNRKNPPVDAFGDHFNRFAGDYQHDANADSRLLQTTVKLHTSLAGGVVGGASARLGQRKNQGNLRDVAGVRAETDFRKLAGDLSVSTSAFWSASFRYRMLDLDSSNSPFLNPSGAAFTNFAPFAKTARAADAVRPALDLTRSSYSAGLSLRLWPLITLKGDYQLEEIRRDQVGEAQPEVLLGVPVLVLNPLWQLPADEKIQTFRVSLLGRSRDRTKLRVNSWYQWRTSDDPSYAASAEDAHEGFIGMTCAVSPKAGGNANFRISRKTNNQHGVEQVSTTGRQSFRLDRTQDQQNVSVGLWALPVEGLQLHATFGWLHEQTVQDLVFGKQALALVSPSADYTQEVENLSLSGTWQVRKNLSLLGELHQIWSEAEFSPEFFSSGLAFRGGTFPVDATGLKQLSRVSLRQFGWKLGAEWKWAGNWSLGLRYAYDRFDDRTGALFDGRVQTTTVSVARSW